MSGVVDDDIDPSRILAARALTELAKKAWPADKLALMEAAIPLGSLPLVPAAHSGTAQRLPAVPRIKLTSGFAVFYISRHVLTSLAFLLTSVFLGSYGIIRDIRYVFCACTSNFARSAMW